MSDFLDFKVFLSQRFRLKSNIRNYKPGIEKFCRTDFDGAVEIILDEDDSRVKIKCDGKIVYFAKISNSKSYVEQLFHNLEIKI